MIISASIGEKRRENVGDNFEHCFICKESIQKTVIVSRSFSPAVQLVVTGICACGGGAGACGAACVGGPRAVAGAGCLGWAGLACWACAPWAGLACWPVGLRPVLAASAGGTRGQSLPLSPGSRVAAACDRARAVAEHCASFSPQSTVGGVAVLIKLGCHTMEVSCTSHPITFIIAVTARWSSAHAHSRLHRVRIISERYAIGNR